MEQGLVGYRWSNEGNLKRAQKTEGRAAEAEGKVEGLERERGD